MKKIRLIVLGLSILMLAYSPAALAGPVELSLDEAVAMAFKNNADVMLARISREKSQWAVKQAEAGKGFTLNFTHTDQRYNGYNTKQLYLNGTYQYAYSNKFDNQLTLGLPIYSGGKLEGQIDKAKLSFKVADLGVAGSEQQTRQSITTYYFTVLQCANNLRISQDTVANYTGHLKNVDAQFAVGIVARSDVLASQVSLANAQNSLTKAENSYQMAVSTLNNAIGLPLSSELKLKNDLEYDSIHSRWKNALPTPWLTGRKWPSTRPRSPWPPPI